MPVSQTDSCHERVVTCMPSASHLGGHGPRESRQDKAIPKCLVVAGSRGGFNHRLAEAILKTLGVHVDVLRECGNTLSMGACPDSQGLRSESAETGVHEPGPNIGHCNRSMFDAGICKGHGLCVLPPFKGLPGHV